MKYKKIIKIDKSIFESLKKESIKLKKDIDELWIKCENKELDCDDVAYLVKQKEISIFNKLILFNIANIFDKEIERKENEIYDVSKIIISKNFDRIMREFDKQIITLFKGDFYKEKYIDKEINMIYLMQGFRVSEDNEQLEDYEFYFMKDFLINKD